MSSDKPAAEGWAVRAARAAEVARQAQTVDEFTDEHPIRGDRVRHFSFGLCDVLSAERGSLKIRPIRGGKVRGIHLDSLRIRTPVEHANQRVFGLEPS